jgi:hypothetical protein
MLRRQVGPGSPLRGVRDDSGEFGAHDMSGRDMTDIARLRIEVDETAPSVVREIEVPLDLRLDDLHFVLQIAIGWQNCHPFEFRSGTTAWGLIDKDDPDGSPLPAERATLTDLLALGPTFKYGYLYGDDWQHTVSVESESAAEPGIDYPRLISAQGRCPPADIGPDGYDEYLRARSDPEHLHHEGLLELDDEEFDPLTVDAEAIRRNLANLAKYLGRRKAGTH